MGLAAGAGLTVLALGATAVHLVVMFAYTPVVRHLPASRHQLVSMQVRYEGRGVLRQVIETTTELGYLVSDLDVDREGETGDLVSVTIDAEGKGDGASSCRRSSASTASRRSGSSSGRNRSRGPVETGPPRSSHWWDGITHRRRLDAPSIAGPGRRDAG